MKKFLNKLNNNKYIIVSSIVFIITILTVLIVNSYSYMTPKIEKINQSETFMKAKKLGLVFEDKNVVNFNMLIPGTNVKKIFDVTSEATEDLIYNVKFVNVNNTYKSDVRYTLYRDGEKVVEETPLPKTTKEEYIYTKVNIKPNEKHTYELKIEYVELKNEEQKFDNASGFNGTLEIDVERPEKNVLFIDDKKETDDTNYTKTFYVKNISSVNDEKYNVIINNLKEVKSSSSLSLAKNNVMIVQDMTELNENDVLYLEEDVTIEKGNTNYYELNIANIFDENNHDDKPDPGVIVDNGKKDIVSPVVIFETNGNETYLNSQSTKVIVSDEISGVNEGTLKYLWTQSEDKPNFNNAGIKFNNNEEITKNNESGTWYLWIYAEDKIGNISVSKSNKFNLDNEAPICNIVGNPENWTQSATLTVEANDSTSNIKSYSWDNITFGETNTKNVTTNGEYKAYVKDSAGNTAECSVNITKVDSDKPTCSLGGNPTSWTQSATLTISGNDETSSIISYSWDGLTYNETKTKDINANGEYKGYVKDSAGNTAECSVITTKIDTAGPTITFGTNGNTTYSKTQSTKVTVTDTGSNVKTLKYLWNTSTEQPTESSFTETFTNEETLTKSDVTGAFYLWIFAIDNAGNKTITKSNVFNIDNTNPTCSISGNPTSWAKSATLTVNGNDTGSSIASYSWDNATYNSTTTKGITSNGTYTAYVKDQAGNIGECSVSVTKVDSVKPTCSISGNPTSWTQSATLTISGSDTISSIASYSWDNATYNSTTTKGITSNGTYTAYVKDNAGNVGNCSVNVSKIDRTGPSVPTITAKLKSTSGTTYTSGAWTNKVIYTTLSSTDTSGIASYEWKENNGSWATLPQTDTFSAQRNSTIYFRAKDNAGNYSQPSSIVMRIDTTAPTCSISGNPGS